MDVTPAELAYQEAVRGISTQADTIDKLRGQASALLGAGSIATAFLGAEGVGTQGLNGWGLVATACFGALGLLTVGLLFPRDGWRFTLAPGAVIESYAQDPPASTQQLYYDVAASLDEQFDLQAPRPLRGHTRHGSGRCPAPRPQRRHRLHQQQPSRARRRTPRPGLHANQISYDLRRLRLHGLIERLPRSNTY